MTVRREEGLAAEYSRQKELLKEMAYGGSEFGVFGHPARPVWQQHSKCGRRMPRGRQGHSMGGSAARGKDFGFFLNAMRRQWWVF